MIYQEIMPFGKYKGEQLVEVANDMRYCQWLIPKMEPSVLRNKLLALAVCIYCKAMSGYTMFTHEEYECAENYYEKYYKGLGDIEFEEWTDSFSYLRLVGNDPISGTRK